MKFVAKSSAPLARSGAAKTDQGGFTLVEVLVGLIIGLLGTLVIFQVFAISEGKKRTTTAGSDAQQSGVFALYTLERYMRAAGSNISPTVDSGSGEGRILGCTTQAYNATPADGNPPDRTPFRLAPVVITDGGVAGQSDRIRVMAGNSSMTRPVALSANFNSTDPTISVKNTMGFHAPTAAQPSDLVVAVASGGGVNCTISQISAPAPATAFGAGLLGRATGGTNIYNKPGNFGVNYTSSGAMIFNLGPNPVFMDFSVNNNQLVARDLLGRTADATLVDDVVNLQAQYGIDTSTVSPRTNNITQWVEPTGVWAAAALTPLQISQIKAIRLGVVVRSSLLERKTGAGAGACDTTTVAPRAWPGGTQIDTSTIPNWQCFRYKTYDTVIPIQNMIRTR